MHTDYAEALMFYIHPEVTGYAVLLIGLKSILKELRKIVLNLNQCPRIIPPRHYVPLGKIVGWILDAI